jgi:DNA-binding MarR family transcriptional regulator
MHVRSDAFPTREPSAGARRRFGTDLAVPRIMATRDGPALQTIMSDAAVERHEASVLATFGAELVPAPTPRRAAPSTTDVLRAWARLDAAMTAYQNEVRRDLGLTALQLSILQLLRGKPVLLRELRATLSVHKATLGQAVKELASGGLCRVVRSPEDARVRIVSGTARGKALVRTVPLAGPLLLLRGTRPPERVRRLRRALEDAVDLFGLDPWADAHA